MKTLRPIVDKPEYHQHVAKILEREWWMLFFKPIFEILQDKLSVRHNAIPVFYVEYADLLPCPYNREIDQLKIKNIQMAISRLGVVKPFVVAEVNTDNGKKFMITDGHHRYLALKEIIKYLKTSKVPCVLSTEAGIETAKGLTPKQLKNSKALLKKALEDGKVQWNNGFFTGPFSASVSKDIRSLGGKWNKTKKAFAMELALMPNDIKAAISSGHAKVNRTIEDIYSMLDRVKGKPIDVTASYEKVIGSLEKQFVSTVSAAKNIAVKPFISPEMKRQIAANYSDRMNTYAEDWTNEEIWRLRDVVAKNVTEGFRSDKLVAHIQAEYGVTKRKAKFLARQETSLMISNYRQARYEEVGLKRYRWSTSHDERVRKDHKELNNRIFAYSDPPITDRATGERNNPGQDFNCRCRAIPVLEN